MLPGERNPVVTRRTVLTGATAAAVTAPLVMGAVSAAAAVPLVQATPVWTEELRRSYGVGVLPAVTAPAYAHVDDWVQRLAALGATYVRGRYQPRMARTAQMVDRGRALGLTCLVSLAPENWSMSE